mgnify:CR=1 FL=1
MSTIKKSWLFLDLKQKRYVSFIFFLMFFAMILESLSVAIVIPIISILLKKDSDLNFLSYFFNSENFFIDNALYFGLLIALVVFIVKNNLNSMLRDLIVSSISVPLL